MLDEAIKNELEKLIVTRGNNQGTLKAAEVVRWCRANPSSALAKRVLKDSPDIAALKWYLSEARKVIRVWVEFSNEAQREIRVLVSVPSDRTSLGAYRRTSDVVQNPRWRGELVEEAFVKLTNLRKQYGFLSELDPFWPRIDQQIAVFKQELVNKQAVG